jgi:hypothetical protein
MLSTIYSIAAFILLLISFAWLAITNRYIRALAKNHPSSLVATVFDRFDKAVEKIVFWDISVSSDADEKRTSAQSTISTGTVPENAVSATEEGKPFSAVHALYVCVSPKAKIPDKVQLLMNPILHLLVFAVLWSSGMMMAYVVISDVVAPEILAPIWGFMLLGGMFFYSYSMMLRDKGYIGLPAKLAMNSELNIFITRKGIYLFSAWGRRALPTKGVQFVANEGPLICELSMQKPGQQSPSIIFAYPALFSSYIPPEQRLSVVCRRLNQLVLFAESMPEFNFDSLDDNPLSVCAGAC